MALSGTLSTNISHNNAVYTYKLSWSATQSTANNTSKISWTAYLVLNKYATLSISSRSDNTVYENGSNATYTSPKISKTSTSSSSTITLGSGSFTVSHSSDGTGSFVLGSTFKIKATIGGTSYTNMTISNKTITLDTIPRASDVSISSATIACGSSATITVSRKVSSFTHTVQILDGSTVIETFVTKGTGTTFTFSPTNATYAPLNIKGTSKALTLACHTYNGSTLIGTKTVSITVTFLASDLAPTISLSNPIKADDVVPSSWNIWVQNQSKVTIDSNVTYKYNATGTVTISGGGYSSTTGSLTTGLLNTSGQIEFTGSVTDSRGKTATAGSKTINVVAWSTPALSDIVCKRVDSSGQEAIEGTNLLVSGNSSFASCNGKNAAIVKIYSKEYGSSVWGLVYSANASQGSFVSSIIAGYNTSKAYDIKVEISDTFKTSSYEDTLSSSRYTLCLRHGGTGIAFGKSAEFDNLIEFDIPIQVNKTSEFKDQISIKHQEAEEEYQGVIIDNATSIAAKDTNGNVRYAFSACNANNNCVLGWGGYNANNGNTNVYGTDINLATKNSIYIKNKAKSSYLGPFGENNVLWSSVGSYMSDSQTANLTNAISNQVHGVVFKWEYYADGSAKNYDIFYFFVPKYHIIMSDGKGIHMSGLTTSSFHLSKYVYVSDTKVTGYAKNSQNFTAGGVTINNASFVLTRIIGV